MRISKTLVGWSLFLIVVACGSIRAQGGNPQDTPESCRKAMQGFYNHVDGKGPKSPSAVLSRELRWLLKDDADNKMDADGLYQGLDYDPIANGNDVSDRYEAGKVTRKGNRYLVEITCFWGNKKSVEQTMKHEVMLSRGRWVIMNIHYFEYKKGKLTEHSNLAGILKKSRADRLANTKPVSGTVIGVIERTESDGNGLHSIFFKVEGRMHQFQILDAKFIDGSPGDLQQGKRIETQFNNRQYHARHDFFGAKATVVRILPSVQK